MARDDGTRRQDSDKHGNHRLCRRTYLKLAGASAATAVAGKTALAAPAGSSPKYSFDQTVNVVEDLNVDSTGSEPVDDAIAEAATPGTKLVFPDGEYLFTQRNTIHSEDGNVGFVGRGDVTFTVPQGFNEYFLIPHAEKILFTDIDVDIDKPETVAGMKMYSNTGLRVENVEYFGRGTHPDMDVASALMPVVKDPNGVGVVKNLVAKNGSAWGHYKEGDGRIGIWVGFETYGTVKLIDLDLREFGNNAIYASRTPGNVQVRGGYFLNNNAAAVRISGKGSYVDGATIEVNPDKYDGPQTLTDNEWYFNGVRIEQGELGPEYKPAGVKIRNCDISFENVSGTTAIPIGIWKTARTVTIEDTRIRIDEDTPAIEQRPEETQEGGYEPPGGARWVKMNGVTITGSGSSGSAVVLQDAPNSVVRNCCIHQTGSGRTGVQMVNCDESIVANSTVNVTGTAVDLVETQAETKNVSSNGTCDASN